MQILFIQTTFMLLLLLLAKGWAVTRLELTWKPLVFAIWFLYGVVHILLYVWNMVRNYFETSVSTFLLAYTSWNIFFFLSFSFWSCVFNSFVNILRTTSLV